MGWFWATEPLEDISPDGGGICGGSIVSAELETDCQSYDELAVSVTFGVELETLQLTETTLDIDGWGLRDLESLSMSECGLDMGNGLQVYGDSNLLDSNVNILRFSGTLLGATNTLNTHDDVTVVSPPAGGVIDGGTSGDNGVEVVDGGDAFNGNHILDGGDSQDTVTTGGTPEISYNQEVDIVSDYLIYKGWALPGSILSDPVWRIQKIIIDLNGDVSKKFADGNDELDNVWNDRAVLNYP